MSETLEAIVLSLLRERKKVTAVKVVRDRMGWELHEAKKFVDRLENDPPNTAAAVSESELAQKARATLQRQGKVAAVKLVRDQTGWGLKQSKDFVDKLA